jgi:hypothetical protein
MSRTRAYGTMWGDPALVARERGISRPALVDLRRDAVGSLASRYELLASAP